MVKQLQFLLSKNVNVDRGLQGKPELAFGSSFLFLGPYLIPIGLGQKPRLVAVVWIFHRKVPRSFLCHFQALLTFLTGLEPRLRGLSKALGRSPELIPMTRGPFHNILLSPLFISTEKHLDYFEQFKVKNWPIAEAQGSFVIKILGLPRLQPVHTNLLEKEKVKICF